MAFPSNEQFQPIIVNGAPLFDPLGDESPASTDIVGNSQFPAAFFAYDGTFVYFRLRLNTDPRFKTGFQNFAWGLLFDTDGDPATYEWLLTVNGLATQLNLIQNTVKVPNSFNDPAEGTDGRGTPNYSQPIVNFDVARAGPTGDGSNFGGNPDFFLDFFIPASVLFRFLGINETSVIRALFFTSANANNYNKDSLLNNGFTLTTAFSEPTTVESADVRAELLTQKVINSGPSSALTGQNLTYTGTLSVTNTGLATASTVLVSDVFGFDQTANVTITSVTGGGLAVYNTLTRTITWNIGNLAPGATQTLSFQASGQFTAPGTRTLNTATASGVDLFTGQQIPPSTATFTVNVVATGGVSGTVLNQSTGLPVEGVTLQLRDALGNVVATTVTGQGGGYGFTGIAPGSYTLVATAPGFQTASIPVTVNPGQVTPVNILLSPLPATVTGRVTDTEGNPLAGALIRLRSPFAVVLQTAVTDANGSYTITNITPGSYSLIAEAQGFRSEIQGISLAPEQILTANFSLGANPASVSGQITSINGEPLAGATVEVLNNANQQIAFTTTDAFGNYAVGSLPPGTLRLRVSEPGFSTQIIGFTVGPGEARVINLSLAPNPGTVSGVVFDAETGAPLPDASVRVVNNAGITVAETLTDANGSYTIPSIPPGNYIVNLEEDGYATLSIGAIVTSGANTVINGGLSKLAGSISGVVTDNGGNPLANTVVRVFLNNIIIATVNTDASGFFQITDLSPGTYVVRAETENFTRALLGASVLPFTNTTVNFQLEPSPGTLTGTVTDAAGNPLAGAVITVRENTAVGPPVGRTLTDTDGSYVLSGLAPGSYIVTADATGFQIGTVGAIIAPGEVENASFVLQPSPATIVGQITNALTGQPISGTSIEVRIVSVNGAIIQNTFTDPNGNYVASDLPPGTYTVVAGNVSFQSNSASVTVEAGETAALNISLQPNPGTIIGQVLSAETQAGLAGATVKVTDENGALLGIAITDSQGTFVVNGLPPGTYTVSAIQPGFQFNIVGVVVESGLSTPTVLNLFPNPGSITGAVVPAPNGTLVQLFDLNNLFIAARIADPDGDFRFDNLAPGSYTVTATATDFITSFAGVTVISDQESEVLLTLLPQPGTVAGTVVDINGNPIPNATIRFLNENEVVVGIATTDINGNYEVGNLPAGNLYVVASANGFANMIGGVSVLPGGAVTGLDFALAPNPGTVTGQVTDVTNGFPIAGATVVIRVIDAQGLIISTVATTVFGNYVINNLAPGSYTIVASANGYGVKAQGVVVVSDVATNANFALSPLFGSISGTITGPDGQPITGGTVQIRLLDERGVLIQTLLSNPDGTFTILNLSPDVYQVNISTPGFVANTVSAIVTAGEITVANVSLEPSPGTLNGTIVNAVTGTGIRGAIVVVTDPNGTFLAQGVSDENGFYSIPRLPAGQVNVTATAEAFGAISTGAIIEPEQITTAALALSPNPGSVNGYVTDITNGNPIVGANVEILDANNVRLLTVLTDGSGFYQVNNLAPGIYTARASEEGFATEFVGFEVVPGGTDNASFALIPDPGTLRGTVTNALTGSPLEGATVELLLSNTFGPPLETVVTGGDGTYILPRLVSNNYTVIVTFPGFASETTAVVLGRGEIQTLDFALDPNPATISGTVTDEAGGPLPDALVRLSDPNGIVFFEVQTGIDGRFLIEGIAPGDYTLTVTRPDRQAFSVFLSLDPGEEAVLTINLQPNPAVQSGTIVMEMEGPSNPIAGAVIHVLDENNILVVRDVSDGEGNFSLPGLAPGTYTVVVIAPTFGSESIVITVGEGEIAPPLVFELHPNPGNLAGTVRDERGMPLYLVNVQVLTLNRVLVRNVVTDRQGRYGVVDLAPGTYLVRFALDGKQTLTLEAVIRANQTTILNVTLLDEDDE